ncbi:hypothetical protein JCM19233_3156 [Vibrio astriarenae]|nr:hypothetical protein JCM19233_3156 [Vibrio sp. C7]
MKYPSSSVRIKKVTAGVINKFIVMNNIELMFVTDISDL